MIEFGEVLTLLIAALTVGFLVFNRRRVREDFTLRPFVGPFLLFVVGWIATVVEDVFWEGVPLQFVVVGQEPSSAASAGLVTVICHTTEHLCYAVAAAWLLWVIIRAWRTRPEATT